MAQKVSKSRGFTLIEILVVIGIIAVLAAVVIVAINPARQFAQARNSQRTSNINSILSALGQNLADNKGVTTCPGVGSGTASSTIGSPTAGTVVDLGTCLAPYLPTGIPMDPTNGIAADTKYQISIDGTGRYLVCAPNSVETGTLNLASVLCVKR
jgi:prepilin-type N-terminal cleavage/methylation domain-containing protein